MNVTNEQYVNAAKKADLVGEVCIFSEYDPDKGRVPEHFKPRFMSFAEALLDEVLSPNVRELMHQRDALAQAIAEAAIDAGICRKDASLTGPHLLMLAKDLGDTAKNLNALTIVDLSANNWAAVFHTAFRHVGNSQAATNAYISINNIPDKEWAEIVEYVMSGIRMHVTRNKTVRDKATLMNLIENAYVGVEGHEMDAATAEAIANAIINGKAK